MSDVDLQGLAKPSPPAPRSQPFSNGISSGAMSAQVLQFTFSELIPNAYIVKQCLRSQN